MYHATISCLRLLGPIGHTSFGACGWNRWNSCWKLTHCGRGSSLGLLGVKSHMTSASNLCCRALGGAAPLMSLTPSWLDDIRGTREYVWAGTGLCWRCDGAPSSIAISASASAASCFCLALAPARTSLGASSPHAVLADDSRALAVPSKPVELWDDRATTRPLPGGCEGRRASDGAGPAASLESVLAAER